MKTIVREIGRGDAAITKTLDHMIRLARRDARTPDVRTLAKKLSTHCEGMTDVQKEFCKVKAAFDWVVDNIDYKFDHQHVTEWADVKNPATTEFLIAPKHQLGVLVGDCDDMSMMLAAILGAMGFKVKYKVIAWRGQDFTHVYVEVLMPNAAGEYRWFPMDPVAGNSGFAWEKSPVIRKKVVDVF
jgi:transglutaminase-like putative cysteine protease